MGPTDNMWNPSFGGQWGCKRWFILSSVYIFKQISSRKELFYESFDIEFRVTTLKFSLSVF